MPSENPNRVDDSTGTLVFEAPLAGVDSVSTTVVTAIADHSSRDPAALTPLYECVDPDALDALFTLESDGTLAGAVTLTFSFEGYRIDITPDGQLLVHTVSTSRAASDNTGTLTD